MKREIWFQKAGWSYIPWHWKGFAAMAVMGLPAAATGGAAIWMLNHWGYRDVALLPFFLMTGLAIIGLRAVAKRTS